MTTPTPTTILFADVSGSTKYGHMHHGVFTIIDADHHVEDWTFMLAGDKPMRARMELHRVKGNEAASLVTSQ